MDHDRTHRHWELTDAVIGALIAVHRHLGPGLLESAYETCLAEELRYRGLSFERQVPIQVTYRGITVDGTYRADLIVEEALLLELKTVDTLAPIHIAQTLTYLRLLELDVALLVNFNCIALRNGIRRLAHRTRRTANVPEAEIEIHSEPGSSGDQREGPGF